jgi:dihydroorotase
MTQDVTRDHTRQPNEFIIANGRLVDPSQSIDHVGWLHVRGGRIVATGSGTRGLPRLPQIDATGLIVAPGLIDMHVHLREPGASHKETIETGCRAAAAGGFTRVCCMPNTSPAIDSVETVRWIQERAAEVGLCRVGVIAAATIGRAGKEPVDFAALKAAGAVGFSDDGDGIEDDGVCRRVLESIRDYDSVLIPHCEFKALSGRGVMHLGPISRRLGLAGYDPRGEEAMIERDLALVAATGARYHVAHISTARGIELVREAKRKGLPVTTEVCPHHLLLCDEDVVGPDGKPDPNFKMSPPLRSREDVAACVEAVRDGAIDCVVTDHAPHAESEKNAGFVAAPMGIVGLETSLGCAAAALLKPGVFDWPDLIERMATAPARVLGLAEGTLRPNHVADVTLIDANLEWTVDPAQFRSKSRNTPFGGRRLRGRAIATLLAGRLVEVGGEGRSGWQMDVHCE